MRSRTNFPFTALPEVEALGGDADTKPLRRNSRLDADLETGLVERHCISRTPGRCRLHFLCLKVYPDAERADDTATASQVWFGRDVALGSRIYGPARCGISGGVGYTLAQTIPCVASSCVWGSPEG